MYIFAQWRQLPAMAPHIPLQDPSLRQTAYEMMLHAFLLSRADHSILLALVKDWPTHLYSIPTLLEAVLHRLPTPQCHTKPCMPCPALSDPGHHITILGHTRVHTIAGMPCSCCTLILCTGQPRVG